MQYLPSCVTGYVSFYFVLPFHVSDNNIANLVTVTTKTFLRYHKLRVLIKSLRQYYADIKLIVADDSEHPEKIEEANVEQYIMPFGKVPTCGGGRGALLLLLYTLMMSVIFCVGLQLSDRYKAEGSWSVNNVMFT